MYRSRKTIVAVAVTAAGVLAMAGVAAAHGGSRPNTEVAHHHRRGHTRTTTSAASVTTATTATTVEHARPEPGNDNAHDTVGLRANDDHGVGAAALPSQSRTGDDNGHDAVGHDANDDHGKDANTTSVTTGVTTSSVPDETSTTVASVPSGTRTFTVDGGTVTVDIQDGALSLVSATPDAGFVIDKSESRSDRVEVEFRGNDTQSRVRVRIEDGQLSVETGDH